MKAGRSGHSLAREVSMAAEEPLPSLWDARSRHWQCHTTLSYPQHSSHQGGKTAFQGSPSTLINGNNILLGDI